MAQPDLLPGQALAAGRLRSIAPWTLLFSGTKTVSSSSSDTVMDTLANTVSNNEIPYSVASGVVTIVEGGLFLVSLVGSFASNGGGVSRRVHVRGSVFGQERLAPFAFHTAATGGTGAQISGAAPIQISPGETVDVLVRQDSGSALSTTVFLGLTKLV